LEVERKTLKTIFEMPQTVSWERVENKIPGIYYDLVDVVEEEKRRFS
jgi:glucosyl-3-phosphoglycerate synthase